MGDKNKKTIILVQNLEFQKSTAHFSNPLTPYRFAN